MNYLRKKIYINVYEYIINIVGKFLETSLIGGPSEYFKNISIPSL